MEDGLVDGTHTGPAVVAGDPVVVVDGCAIGLGRLTRVVHVQGGVGQTRDEVDGDGLLDGVDRVGCGHRDGGEAVGTLVGCHLQVAIGTGAGDGDAGRGQDGPVTRDGTHDDGRGPMIDIIHLEWDPVGRLLLEHQVVEAGDHRGIVDVLDLDQDGPGRGHTVGAGRVPEGIGTGIVRIRGVDIGSAPRGRSPPHHAAIGRLGRIPEGDGLDAVELDGGDEDLEPGMILRDHDGLGGSISAGDPVHRARDPQVLLGVIDLA